MINYLTASELADRLNITRQAVHKAIKQGRLKAIKRYGRLLISASEAARWEKERKK